jgi:hypothetical protein
MKKLEKILGVAFLIALILKLTLLPGGGILATFSLLILANLYFLFGFALFNQIALKDIFKGASYNGIPALRIIGAIGTGSALSVLCVGILFRLQHWPGASINIITGVIVSLIILIIVLIKYFKAKEQFYFRILKRLIILGGLGFILLNLSDSTIIKFQFRNHPDYIKAYELYIKNPQDETLRNNLDLEYYKATMSEKDYEIYLKSLNNQ